MGVVIAVILVVAILLATLLIGARLPVRHRVSRTTDLPVPPERLWRALIDPSEKRRWGGSSETVEAQPGRRLVTRIVGESSFGGTWTFEIEPVRNGSRLVITEDGEIYNAVFRFVSKYLIGHSRTIDTYLAQLRRQLNAS